MKDTQESSLAYNIQDAELEISMAIGCLEWAKMIVPSSIDKSICDHIDQRIAGLEKALAILKGLEKADVHGSEQN